MVEKLLAIIISLIFSFWLFGGMMYRGDVMILERKLKDNLTVRILNLLTLPQMYILLLFDWLGNNFEKFMNKLEE